MEQNREVIAIKVEPLKRAKVIRQSTDLRELEKVVGGIIEFVHPYEEDICIVCNDCGRYQCVPNRFINVEETGYYGVIFGSFLILRERKNGFEDLTIDDIKKYLPAIDYFEVFSDKGYYKVKTPPDSDDLRFMISGLSE